MTTPQENRELCLSIAAENVANAASNEFEEPIQLFDAVLCCVSFALGEVSETELREFLTSAGIDLTDYSQFELAQDVASLWVACGAIEITDLYSGSLVDCDTPLVRRIAWDEEMKERIVQVGFEGRLFRDFVIAQSML